ncbi:hypothetical protein PIB30_059293 [Stylosanthes scabra]|uniref:Uncharacterized protein n=1 Tax=Stylosanthes scabra TaxID=79078 RepID=A0ABU6TL37_9FABA|nr:hypothetical protein [Stylosanthes scabra]
MGYGQEDQAKLAVPHYLAFDALHHSLFDNILVGMGLGHGMLWTKIFEHFSINLSSEEAVYVDDGSAITSRHLNKMGRGPKAAVEENVDADEEGPHPQGVGSSAHFSSWRHLPKECNPFSQVGARMFNEWIGGWTATNLACPIVQRRFKS